MMMEHCIGSQLLEDVGVRELLWLLSIISLIRGSILLGSQTLDDVDFKGVMVVVVVDDYGGTRV